MVYLKMIISTPTDHKIANEFFRDYTNGTTVSKKLYPNSFNIRKAKLSKIKNVGAVSSRFAQWRKQGYIQNKTVLGNRGFSKSYRLNLIPFFEYISINKKEEFSKLEKRFLEYIFNAQRLREEACEKDNLFDGILSVLERVFFYEGMGREILAIEIAKGFFARDKRLYRKEKDSITQFKTFWNKLEEFLSLFLIKMRKIVGVKFDNIHLLDNETKKYSAIPYSIFEDRSNKVNKGFLKRFEIVFYEKREPTFKELLDTR